MTSQPNNQSISTGWVALKRNISHKENLLILPTHFIGRFCDASAPNQMGGGKTAVYKMTIWKLHKAAARWHQLLSDFIFIHQGMNNEYWLAFPFETPPGLWNRTRRITFVKHAKWRHVMQRMLSFSGVTDTLPYRTTPNRLSCT